MQIVSGFQIKGQIRGLPAEKPSTGCLVNSASCLRRRRVLDAEGFDIKEDGEEVSGGVESESKAVPGSDMSVG